MTVTDDDRFPPIRKDSEQDTPLDLSVLAKVSTAEDPRPYKQEKPKDSPPRARARAPRGTNKTDGKQAEDKPSASPRTFVRDEETPEYRPGLLVKPLRDLYVSVGTLVLPFNQAVGTAFIQNAEACARSLDNAAKADKQIRRVLMLLITGSVWGEVIVAHMPIMMALAVTMVPAVRQSLNVESPQTESETINPVSNGYATGR